MKSYKAFLFFIASAMLLGTGSAYAQNKGFLFSDSYCVYKNGDKVTISEGFKKYGNDIEYIDFCCNALKICPKYIDRYGKTLTHVTAEANWTAATRTLITKYNAPIESWRFDWDAGVYTKEYTQLMYAVRNNNFDLVKFLIEVGANTTTRNKDGHDSKYFAQQLKDGDKNLIAFVLAKWNEEMGISAANIKKKTDDLIDALSPYKHDKQLAAKDLKLADFRTVI